MRERSQGFVPRNALLLEAHLRPPAIPFRDFVIGRILEVKGSAPPGPDAQQDAAWNTTIQLVLAPHPKLPAAHRRAVALDCGMADGTATLECRQAFLFYVLRHVRLEAPRADAKPEEQQVVLKNWREIERVRRRLEGR